MKLHTCIAVTCLVFLLSGCDSDPNPGIPAPDETEVVITSDRYENNRFFKLDLPVVGGASTGDIPGRDAGQERIRFPSLHIFKLVPSGPPEPVDLGFVAAYRDTTGVFWNTPGAPANDFQAPVVHGTLWRELAFEPILSPSGNLDGVDLGEQMDAQDVLAIRYAVEDMDGNLLYSVGDDPESGNPSTTLPGQDGYYYRMKLLKAAEGMDAYSFRYVMRNFYDLGQRNIDPGLFRLTIEKSYPAQRPDADEQNIPYIRLFGLDQRDIEGDPVPDGLVDVNDPAMFDMVHGWLRFPMEEPFNAGRQTYETFADSASFLWEYTYLSTNQAPQLYDFVVPASEYPLFGRFILRVTYRSDQSRIAW